MNRITKPNATTSIRLSVRKTAFRLSIESVFSILSRKGTIIALQFSVFMLLNTLAEDIEDMSVQPDDHLVALQQFLCRSSSGLIVNLRLIRHA